jgi:hypothetical protein
MDYRDEEMAFTYKTTRGLVGELTADVRRFDLLGSTITQHVYHCCAIISRANPPPEGPAICT